MNDTKNILNYYCFYLVLHVKSICNVQMILLWNYHFWEFLLRHLQCNISIWCKIWNDLTWINEQMLSSYRLINFNLTCSCLFHTSKHKRIFISIDVYVFIVYLLFSKRNLFRMQVYSFYLNGLNRTLRTFSFYKVLKMIHKIIIDKTTLFAKLIILLITVNANTTIFS